MSTTDAALAVSRISKTFHGTRALRNVSISFRQRAVTALLGPNGCGKSTLIKILAGFHAPDHGHGLHLHAHGVHLDAALDAHGLHLHDEAGADDGPAIEIEGAQIPVPVHPNEVYARGLRFVHQDLALVDAMSVADNLALTHAFGGTRTLARLRRGAVLERARSQLARFDLDIDPRAAVGDLSRTDQIMVAIARAFDAGGRIVILDEPTASLPAGSVDRVLDAARRIIETGGSVVYVTHRIDEVIRIADDVVVLRDGEVAAARALGDLDADGLGTLIAGAITHRPASERTATDGAPVLEARALAGTRLHDINFSLHRGEILGVAGLAGCGRSELARILAGVQRPTSGSLVLDGREVSFSGPRAAIDAGVAFVPPERKRFGCIPDMSVRHNVTLTDLGPWWSGGVLRQHAERSSVAALMETFDVRPRDTERRVEFLSGGNQQKAVMAKFARLEPQVMIVDEPTQGVDISGKQGIADVIRRSAAEGCAVVLASSDFDEIADLCDRVLVLDRGAAVGILPRGAIHEQQLAVLRAGDEQGG